MKNIIETNIKINIIIFNNFYMGIQCNCDDDFSKGQYEYRIATGPYSFKRFVIYKFNNFFI